MKTIITTSLLTLAITSPSNAQSILSNCNTYENTQKLLIEQYQEAPFWEGLFNNGMVVFQGWINQETGSWSLIAILPDGTSCIFADGQHYTFVDVPIPGEEM